MKLVAASDLDVCRGFPGFEWVAWRNTTADGALEMTFEFDGVRNFSAVVIHTNADQQKGVEVCECLAE